MSGHQKRFLMMHNNFIKKKKNKSVIRSHDVGIDSPECQRNVTVS